MRALLLLSVLLLTSCGFRPMYGDHVSEQSKSVQSNLSHVDIGIIPNREGQLLRNALIDRFYATNGTPVNPTYQLSITEINETRAELDITKTAEATRAQLSLTTSMTLTDISTGKPVLSRSLRTITSYNVLESEFATRVSETNARENGIQDLARQIERDVGLYFTRSSEK